MKNFIIVFLVLILLGGAGFGTLVYLGVIHLSAPQVVHPVNNKPPEGTVAVPLSVRRVPAYQRVTRDDLIDPKTAKPVYVYLRPSTGPNSPLFKPSDILGRVLRHDKEPGYVFLEADFFPVGTEPGDAAAIPPGKRAMTIDAAKLSGAYSLLPGNHVDLVASQVIDSKGAKIPNLPMLSQNPGAIPPGAVKRATFTVLVQDGVVITPVTQRQSTYMGMGGGLVPASELKKKPVQEIMIAMDPDEVPKLTEALAAGAEINCFLRSAQPTTAPASQASIPEVSDTTQSAVHVVETIVGRQHNYVYVPVPATPTPAPAAPAAPAQGKPTNPLTGSAPAVREGP